MRTSFEYLKKQGPQTALYKQYEQTYTNSTSGTAQPAQITQMEDGKLSTGYAMHTPMPYPMISDAMAWVLGMDQIGHHQLHQMVKPSAKNRLKSGPRSEMVRHLGPIQKCHIHMVHIGSPSVDVTELHPHGLQGWSRGILRKYVEFQWLAGLAKVPTVGPKVRRSSVISMDVHSGIGMCWGEVDSERSWSSLSEGS